MLKAGCANGGMFREEENKTLPPSLEPRPERVAVEPTATQRAIGSAGSAAAAFLIKAALEHLSHPRQEARPRGWFARPSR